MYVAMHLGMVVAFAIGTYCSYEITPLVAITINLVCFVLFLNFPESPLYLVKNEQIQVSEIRLLKVDVHF